MPLISIQKIIAHGAHHQSASPAHRLARSRFADLPVVHFYAMLPAVTANAPIDRYGLGQTYEILTMYYYALFYYRKATSLRPYDARMWCAMAGCYKLLNRRNDAIKCYQRAEANNDREGIAFVELARLFRELPHLLCHGVGASLERLQPPPSHPTLFAAT